MIWVIRQNFADSNSANLSGDAHIGVDSNDFLAATSGEEGKVSGDTPHPGKGLRPLHSCVLLNFSGEEVERNAWFIAHW